MRVPYCTWSKCRLGHCNCVWRNVVYLSMACCMLLFTCCFVVVYTVVPQIIPAPIPIAPAPMFRPPFRPVSSPKYNSKSQRKSCCWGLTNLVTCFCHGTFQLLDHCRVLALGEVGGGRVFAAHRNNVRTLMFSCMYIHVLFSPLPLLHIWASHKTIEPPTKFRQNFCIQYH